MSYRHHATSSSKYFSNTFCNRPENKDVLKVNSLNRFTSTLNEYRKEGRFCDFEIKIMSKVFPTHKLILSTASPYFEAMFKNANYFIENSNNFVEIKEIDNPKIIETILNYIYTGEIEVDSNNVQEIVQISSIFQLTELIEYCIKFLIDNLQTNNCIGILCFADIYGLSKLCFEAKRFTEKNFAEIIKEDEFLELSPNQIKSFLKSENLSITSEYQVLVGTIGWILHKPQDRMQYLDEFLNIIRMPLISPECIETFLKKCEHQTVVETIRRYLKQEKFRLTDEYFDGYDTVRCKPRMASRRSIYLFGGQGSLTNCRVRNDLQTLCLVEKFNFHIGTWEMVKSLLYPRSSHCVVQLNNKLFIIGGICDSLILETMEIYDPSKEESTLGSNLMVPRSAFGACAHDSYIYVFGGLGGGGIHIEQYNPIKNVWQIYDQMPSYRYGMQVIEHDGLIYIIGGVDDNEIITNSVLSYDPNTKTFVELAPLNKARKSFAATVMHNYIYVVGGLGHNNQYLNSVEQYNINEDKWSYVTEMPKAKSNLCAVSINNLVYVYGGQTSANSQQNFKIGKTVFVYDPEVNQWLTAKPMTQGRKDAAVIVV